MKKVIKSILAMMLMTMASCSSTQSLQEYYVDNTENPNFLFFDVPASILNVDEVNLTDTQKTALSSLKKLNILAFKKTTANVAEYKTEKTNIKAILSNGKFTELMKMNTEYGKATIKYKGEENAIDEVIIYGDNDDKGFAVVRILGDDMNPAHFVQLMQAIQKSDYKGEGLGEIVDLFKN
ncbi:DUF4252 domain-containing protein [Maribacter sp. 2210JD10-5]|uniref:DUF4252 domain-containing protein n=1 Tax=Maribacter sp. 2210JD10-5 TaxID=3386272 RepID=UPI0039BC9C30